MAGFYRRAWGGAKSTTQNNTTQQSDDNKWNLTIKSAKYSENGDLGFKVKGFIYKDIDEFNKIAPDVFYMKIGIDKATWLWVKAGKFDEFIADITPLENFLRSTNNYKETAINTFGEKLERYAETTPTKEEISLSKRVKLL
jgi:hypothetical protein